MARKKGKKKKRRYTKKKRPSKKKHTMGLGGRIGAVIVGVGPPATSALEAVADANFHRQQKANFMSILNKGWQRFVNNMAQGYGLKVPFSESITMTREDGSTYTTRVGAGIPAGTHWAQTILGFVMIGTDRIASFINGNRGVNIPMTHYRAIGNY